MDIGASGGDLEILRTDGTSLGRHVTAVAKHRELGWFGAVFITETSFDEVPEDELIVSTEQGLLTMHVQQSTGGPENFLLVLVQP